MKPWGKRAESLSHINSQDFGFQPGIPRPSRHCPGAVACRRRPPRRHGGPRCDRLGGTGGGCAGGQCAGGGCAGGAAANGTRRAWLGQTSPGFLEGWIWPNQDI